MADGEDKKHFSDVAYSVIRLKRATWKLRAEALRRYRQRHQGSLDRAEGEIEQLFETSRQVAPLIPEKNVAADSRHHEETAIQVSGVQDAKIKSSIAEGIWVAAKSHVDFSIETMKQPTKETGSKSAATKISAKPNLLTKSRTNPWDKDDIDDNEMVSLRVRGSAVIRQGRKGTGKEVRIKNYDIRSGKSIINTGKKSKLDTREDKGEWKDVMEVESAYDENDSVFDDQINFEDTFIDDDFKHPSVHISHRISSHRNASFATGKHNFDEDFDREQGPSQEFIEGIYQLPVRQSDTGGSTANGESGFIKKQQEHSRFSFKEENNENTQEGGRHSTPVDQLASTQNSPVETKGKMYLSSAERRRAENARVTSSAGPHQAETEGKLKPSAIKNGRPIVTNGAEENEHKNEVTRQSRVTDVENRKYSIAEKREVSMEQENVSRSSSRHSAGKSSRLSNDSKFGYGLHPRHHRHGSRSIDLPSSGRHFAGSLSSSVDLPTANDQDTNSSLESDDDLDAEEDEIPGELGDDDEDDVVASSHERLAHKNGNNEDQTVAEDDAGEDQDGQETDTEEDQRGLDLKSRENLDEREGDENDEHAIGEEREGDENDEHASGEDFQADQGEADDEVRLSRVEQLEDGEEQDALSDHGSEENNAGEEPDRAASAEDGDSSNDKEAVGQDEANVVATEQSNSPEVLSARVAQEPKNILEDSSGGEEEGDEDTERKNSKKRSRPANGMSPDTRGDEDEIASEQMFSKEDEEEKIPDDFYYEYQEHVSKASVTDESGLPMDLLTLDHAFGYECLKRANLHILEKDVIMFAVGNYVQIVNLKTQLHTYIRSTSGLGIGALTVHPSRKLLAVAEKGQNPNINVYEYPSLRLYRILRGGTERVYSFVDFSPDGKLMASVGGDPDYMLTLWDWKQEKIVLRSKAFSQDVFRVTFSTDLEGQLTSSGVGHIRFWKMASTFTGLKLQGQLGKFGKKEISDIEGYVELPDGKVLSGSESGNMLLWDGGLIKVEIGRKNRKMCHAGAIQQIIMDEGELMTIGMDGYIRVWDFETIDNADTTDESDCFEMEPMNELKVGNDVQLKCMVKSCDPEETTIWYAQDACGSIWRLDLSFSFTSTPPERLLSYHAGAIKSCCTSPITNLVATTGVDHTVRVFDYSSKTQLCSAHYNTAGSSMMWVPSNVDSKGSTILVGFDDGVVRLLSLQKMEGMDQHGRKLTDKSELLLRQALKPHKLQVTSLAVDHKGEILATGSKDSTVFFFNVGDHYEPIGFTKTPSAVTHLDWSPASFKRNTLLVCCEDGQVLEVERPDPEKYDTSHTFEITGLSTRSHQFKSVKSVIRHEEEVARKAKEEEERKRIEEEERLRLMEKGLLTETDKEDEAANEMDKKEEVEEVWVPYIPEKPSCIRHGFHAKDEGKFWLSMGDYDAGFLYECEFLDEDAKVKLPRDQLHEPTRVIPIHNSDDVAIGTVLFSQANRHLFLGMNDGAVRIQPLHSDDPGLMGPYWSLTVHDNQYGSVTSMAMSYDGKHLFSVGQDGNFFSFLVMDNKRLEKKIAEARATIPSAKKELTELRVDDIADPKAYSIEDAKQKAEYDKMLLMAEQKKMSTRELIQSLREQFQKLVERNNSLPPHLAINRKEFEMDPEIKKELLRQKEARIALVKKEMAWEAAKHDLALKKLQSRFKDCVECELITIKAFNDVHEVSSFRLTKLSDNYLQLRQTLERKQSLLKEELARQETVFTAKNNFTEDTSAVDDNDRDGSNAKQVTTSVRGNAGERILKALAKVDEKKRRRAARLAQWQELNTSKPDDDYEDPEEVAAIHEAKEHTGDYKLKSADDFVVPDHLRMNTEKALMKLLVLNEHMHSQKRDFNNRLLAAREKKIQIINEIQHLVSDVQNIQSLLGPQLSKPLPEIPKMYACELPERKYECSRETLVKFKEQQTKNKSQAPGQTGSSPAFGAIGGGPSRNSLTAASSNKLVVPTPTLSVTKRLISADEESEFSVISDYTQWADDSQLNELQKQIKQMEQIRLLYKRDHLLEHIDDLLKNFDAELRCLRHEKFQLDIDMKNADLRELVLFQELLLLKEFEKTENVLSAKLQEKLTEKSNMDKMIAEVNVKLELKKKDIEKLTEREAQEWSSFKESIGDSKFTDFLTKVYKKKIRRSRKKASDGAGGEEDSDSDSEDESDMSESDEESDSEVGPLDLDVCPPGCDQTLYDTTCLQREKRLDIEESLADEKKTRDALVKEIDGLQRKAKTVEGATRTAEQDLEAFQLQKQRHLNELDVIVTMRLHQIEHVVNGTLPGDLSQCLVFESRGVSTLQRRIQELEHERIAQKRQKRDAKRQHVELVKDRRLFDQRITQLNDECEKLMVEKFGRVVDIEKLETVTVNRQIEEVKDRLSMADVQFAATLQLWQDQIREAKDELTGHLRINTERLDQMTSLLRELRAYEENLDKRQNNLGAEFRGVRSSEIEERKRLVHLVRLQATEIEALKDEIVMLSRKGGHVAPPTQPSVAPQRSSRHGAVNGSSMNT